MNKETQIKEIYRILLDGCNGIDCYECEGNGKKDGCLHYHNANTIYAKGYRKASDVAEEIFAEIGKTLHRWGSLAEQDHTDYGELMELVVGDVISNIAELKKKYESEDTE